MKTPDLHLKGLEALNHVFAFLDLCKRLRTLHFHGLCLSADSVRRVGIDWRAAAKIITRKTHAPCLAGHRDSSAGSAAPTNGRFDPFLLLREPPRYDDDKV